MILNVYGETIKCDMAIKGTDYIRCYKANEVIAEFSGISDFSGYLLTDDKGNPAEFSAPEPSESERLKALESAMLSVMMGGVSNV